MFEVNAFGGISALVVVFYVSYRYLSRSSSPHTTPAAQPAESPQKPLKSIMSAPRDDLAPPKDDPYTPEQLKAFDGSDTSKPIYVAIKGMT
jgi:hypothetical protein